MNFEIVSKASSEAEHIRQEDYIDLGGKIKVDEDDDYVVLMSESTVSKKITVQDDYISNF